MNETRAKAGAILSAGKMRQLEQAGMTVVTKERLESLERIAQFLQNHSTLVRDLVSEQAEHDGYGSASCVNDPRDFIPDMEVCTTKEIEAWQEAVRLANEGESVDIPRHRWVTDGYGRIVAHVANDSWGIGTYIYRDEHWQKVLDDLDGALAELEVMPK